jgi:DnaJ-class molecular chaperone
MNSQEYYETLGVTHQSTQDEIRKAYRRLSLIHHPDKNGGNNDDTFQKINEAYETLGDPQKRRMYELSGQTPFGNAHVMEVPIDTAALFNMFFAHDLGNNPDIHVFQGTFPKGANRERQPMGHGMPFSEPEPEPIVKTLHISMEEAYNGCCKHLDIERWITRFHRKVREKETIYVDVPQGIGDNENIIIKEKGNMYSKNTIGDIKVMISIDSTNCKMDRDGLDLIYKHTITLKQSLCGFSFSLKHISGKEFNINNTKGNIIHPAFKKIVPGYGFIRNEHHGNLIIEFIVEFPTKLSEEQITTIENIF